MSLRVSECRMELAAVVCIFMCMHTGVRPSSGQRWQKASLALETDMPAQILIDLSMSCIPLIAVTYLLFICIAAQVIQLLSVRELVLYIYVLRRSLKLVVARVNSARPFAILFLCS